MFYRDSILFKLNILFFITTLLLSILFVVMHGFIMKKNSMDFEFSIMKLERELENYKDYENNLSLQEVVKNHNFIVLQENSEVIAFNAKKVSLHDFFEKHKHFKDEKREHHRSPHRHFKENKKENIELLEYKNEIFIALKNIKNKILLQYDTHEALKNIFLIWLVYLLFILLLLTLYIHIRKNIKNLSILQQSFLEYENGIVDTTKIIEGNNEVAVVSKQFYKVVLKLQSIENSRKLFLRNIMHELKTPLTKSQLYLGLLEESQTTQKLQNSLKKLELLIEEMANIEKISTNNATIEKKEYRLIDIIDNAKDMLFIDDNTLSVDNVEGCSIEVDFKLFTIVLKNLIDNGIKYSHDKQLFIECKDKKIYISSYGEQLKYSFENYLEPFFKGELNEVNQKGFGLGLYIVNEILKKHKYKLAYLYENKKNIFIINLQ